MDSCILDVLHYPADHDLVSVGDRVHVRLERILEEPVDQNRPVFRDSRCALEVVLQRWRIIDDLHRPSAENVRRPHEYGIADLLSDRDRFGKTRCGAVRWLPYIELARDRIEPSAVLSCVDGIG